MRPATIRRRVTTASLVTTLALAVVPTAVAHPGAPGTDAEGEPAGLGVEVLSPDGLTGFFPAVQWSGTAEVDDQTAPLAYAGTGCSPASYAAADVEGRIALIDSFASETNPADLCPASTFFQKVQSAQRAGAIGLVQVLEVDEEAAGGNAVAGDIPAVEVERSEAVLAVRDAVIDGTAVEAALRNIVVPVERMSDVPCVDGQAGPFACDGVDLLALVPQEEFNGAGISDLWGWTDPDSGDEYVIIGKTNGVAFFRITDPTDPEYLGELPNPGLLQEVWHDIKVYANHAFVVSESEPPGMRVFDLTRLRDVEEPQQFDADALYPLADAAHNLEINTETGFAYILGGNAGIVAPDMCLSGLHIVDVNDPQQPTFAGCYLQEGGPGTAARTVGPPATDVSPLAYVHDAQCVVYDGPDAEHVGQEVCFNAAETEIVIADVTDKLLPTTLAVAEYPHVGYTHQAWLTEDHRYLIVNDELDELEQDAITNTRTLVFDVTDLDDPTLHLEYFHETEAITHNNYVHDGLAYLSNYSAGLRVLDLAGVADADLEEIAFFDTFPSHDDTTFDGTWSNYPFFPSGTIAVSGRAEGLFLLELQDDDPTVAEPGVEVTCTNCPLDEIRAGESGTAMVAVTNVGNVDDEYEVTVSGMSAGWSARVTPARFALADGASEQVEIVIDVPRRARKGTYQLVVTATSTQYADVSGSADVAVGVRKGRPTDPGSPQARATTDGDAATAASAPTAVDGATVATEASIATPAALVAGLLALALLAGIGLRRRVAGRGPG